MKWLAAAALLLGGGSLDVELRGLRHPALSPDGRTLAFSWGGDLWVCPAEGGTAGRITTDPADERKPCWSPDGRSIAFSSDAAGTRDLWVVDLATRAVRRLTWNAADDDAPAWSPDGAWIAFQSNRDPNLDLATNDQVWDVWRMPAGGGTAERVTRFRGENPAWSPDGAWIAYDRYATGYGDGEHNIFMIAADGGGLPREIAAGAEDSRRPVFRDKTIYFSHEANGVLTAGFRNVWRASIDGGPLHQVTGHRGDHVTWPTTAGALLVYEYDFDLYAVDLRAPRGEPRKLSIRATLPEPAAARDEALASPLRTPSWSPTGRRLAFAANGRIWTSAPDGGEAAPLTAGPEEDRDPAWTSDGAAVVFVSGPSGLPGQVWSASADGATAPRLLIREAGDYRRPRMSPDDRRLLVVDGAVVKVVDLRSAEVWAAGPGTSAAWAPDGRSIYVLREEQGGSAVLRIPLNGDPAQVLRKGTARREALEASPDGRRLAWSEPAERLLKVAGIDGEQELVAGRNAARPSWAPDGSMLLAETSGRGSGGLVVVDARGEGRLALEIRGRRPLAQAEEMRSVFAQVWAAYWQNYYDPFFHGVDMPALRRKYLPFAEACRTKAELYDLINDLLRELRSSHILLKPPPPKESTAAGSLGADLGRNADGSLRIRRLEPKGPAALAGLREGDILLAAPSTDLDRLLTSDGEFSVQGADGERRTVRVKGVTRTALRELKYANQVEARKARVKELSNGRLGYFHIRMMAVTEVARLKEALEKEFPEAEGLVFDERDGMGGFAHRPVCALLDSGAPERLNRHPACVMRNRDGSTTKDVYGSAKPPARSWNRPVIMIQNEISRSDKEILPHTFRHLGIGYLVGMPTAGGVIGGNEWTMRDGSKIVVSTQGWFTIDGRNMEGYGVPPDYRVPLTHEDLYAGRDPQLDKAVEILLAQMDGRIAAPRKPEPPENK